MIFAKLNSDPQFRSCPEPVRQALRYLREADLMAMPLGRHDIQGDDIFLNLMEMTTHPLEDSHPEVHEKYIDLMYWPEGGERIGVAPYLGTEAVFEARPENDIALLEEVANESFLVATEGCFGLFFPWDAHRPGLFLGDGPATSRKAVVKIRAALLDG